MGRHLKCGQLPFATQYLFGGNYDLSRDVGYPYWHPFYLLPALLSDTVARFWILDVVALLFLLLTSTGFTTLTYVLREEFDLKIPDIYLIFYTLSFVFSTYILMTGSSWINFLGNQSALPWLVLGILDKKMLRGTALVSLFTIHQLLGAYAALTISTGLCLTVFAAGVAFIRHSPMPFFIWCMGNLLALLILTPVMIHSLDGFAHSVRILGLPLSELSQNAINPGTFLISFFVGNWSEPLTVWAGDTALRSLIFPYPSILLACAAAWCLVPALIASTSWRSLEILCFGMAGLLALFIIRPDGMNQVIHQIPFLKSMRWPFREGMQFLFFIHLFLILRYPAKIPRWQPAFTLFSLVMFLLPLPFIRVPTFNPFYLDRELLFSGKAERFWAGVKTQLKPTDEIATVIDWPYWQANSPDIPYTLLGTANYPELLKVRCVEGYSTTAPTDQVPLKTPPGFWFGTFYADQVQKVLAEKPDLRVLRIVATHPLQITMSNGSGPPTDLTPYLKAAGIVDQAPPSGH